MKNLSIRNYRDTFELADKDIDGDLSSMQQEVDGHIETVTIAKDLVLVCDEEGRLKDRPVSVCLVYPDHESGEDAKYAVGIHGDCFICQRTEGDLVSLSRKKRDLLINHIMEKRIGIPCIDIEIIREEMKA